jgi:hypothetical protein
MSQDDFPPTQQAPPPPPEPPPQPERDPRSLTHPAHVYEGIEQLLPARTWKENPLVWIALVVAMFMAVPLLASLTTRDKPVAPKPRAEASPPAQEESTPAPVAVPTAAPAPTNGNTAPSPPAANVNQLPPNLRPQTDASRQMIAKCYENGRVVYTQTGACTGSMTAVPIDTGKNVIGPGGAAAPAGNTR